jgi:hypothetical protein
MGWMTLHSIAASYPHEPAATDKAILNEYMNAFAFTIPCHICNSHFSGLFSEYKTNVPTWANSKKDLFVAICRMHNVVNARLDKPKAFTVAQAIEWLKNATSYTSQTDFRKNYLTYLSGQFKSRAIYATSISKMKKITEEYWNPREVSYSLLEIPEDDILSYKNQAGFNSRKFKISSRNVRFKVPLQH